MDTKIEKIATDGEYAIGYIDGYPSIWLAEDVAESRTVFEFGTFEADGCWYMVDSGAWIRREYR